MNGCAGHAPAEAIPLCASCWRWVTEATRARVRQAFDRGGSFTYAGVAMPTGEWDSAVWLATFEAKASQGRRRMCST